MDFSFSNITLELLNEFEVVLLQLFNYQIQVTPEEYFQLNNKFNDIILAAKLNTTLLILHKNATTTTSSSSCNDESSSQVVLEYQSISSKVIKQNPFQLTIYN